MSSTSIVSVSFILKYNIFGFYRGRTLPYSSCFGDVAPIHSKPESRKSKRKRSQLPGEEQNSPEQKDSPPARWVSMSPTPGTLHSSGRFQQVGIGLNAAAISFEALE